MHRRLLYIALAGILVTSIASGQTIIPGGDVSGIWTASGSPYLIQGNIAIPTDSTLHIEPCVEVIFQSVYDLTVRGYLEAVGTEADSIHFYPANTGAGWHGISFSSAPDSSHMSYCTVRHALYGGSGGGISCSGSNPVISHCTISDCEGTESGGIYCRNSGATITHCTITRNHTWVSGGGIKLTSCSTVLSDCTITDNSAPEGGGVHLYNSSLDQILRDCVISGNTADNRGGGLYISSCITSVSLTGCIISDNVAIQQGGGCISLAPRQH